MSELLRENKNGWEVLKEDEMDKAINFCEGYIDFLNSSKTERLAVIETIKIAEKNGFSDISTKDKLVPGDKVYFNNRGKGIYLAVIGKKDISEGINFVIAHVDSPRLDLKANPLYEDSDMALLKTHYYGGIKKYQWTSIPLSLIGVVFKKDGTKVDISIGEDENDPVFCVSDLLPHLASKQMQKKLSEAIEGESLNIIIGSVPDDAEKDRFKTAIMKILNSKYGICEQDFVTAEIEAVPSFKAKDLGLDRSMVGGYGQDDRVCAYAALSAVCETENPEKTVACVLVDKEEIGSMGNTGMKSAAFEYATSLIISKTKGEFNDLLKMQTLRNSKCISADVNAAFDPNYPEVNEKFNAAYFGHGPVLTKFTGSRGKSGTSDANAEFVSEVRNAFDKNGVIWQTGELGRVDIGGGGTIAQFAANLDIEVVDCGTALLSMHAPFEVASKLDIYMTYRAYKAFITL
ncbi:MAG: aminopeptidase [Clostridia bacterium]|nr:aminopeptidase [Clostridia bacterium]